MESEYIFTTLTTVIRILGIVFSLFHFLAIFILYRDVMRITKVVESQNSSKVVLITFIHVLFTLAIFALFIIV